jgi:hypothetical protein
MVEFTNSGKGGLEVARGGDGGKGNQIHIAVEIRKKWKCIYVDLSAATAGLAGDRRYQEASNWVQGVPTERVHDIQKHLI